MFKIIGGTHNNINYSTMLEYSDGVLNEVPYEIKDKGEKKLYAFKGIADSQNDASAILWFDENMKFVKGEII